MPRIVAVSPVARAQIDDAGWFAMEIGLGVGGSVRACNLATKACQIVADDVPVLTAIAYRGSALWGAIWAAEPEPRDALPSPPDVLPLLRAFAP